MGRSCDRPNKFSIPQPRGAVNGYLLLTAIFSLLQKLLPRTLGTIPS